MLLEWCTNYVLRRGERKRQLNEKQNVLKQQVAALVQICYRQKAWNHFNIICERKTPQLTTSLIALSLSLTFVSTASPLSPHRRSSQSRSSLVLDPHINGALWRGKQQDFPRAGGGGGRVESLIAGAGDDHYLVVLGQVNTPRVQQSLKVSQQILGRLPCYQSLWHGSVSQSTPSLGSQTREMLQFEYQHPLGVAVLCEFKEQWWNLLKVCLPVFTGSLDISLKKSSPFLYCS